MIILTFGDLVYIFNINEVKSGFYSQKYLVEVVKKIIWLEFFLFWSLKISEINSFTYKDLTVKSKL